MGVLSTAEGTVRTVGGVVPGVNKSSMVALLLGIGLTYFGLKFVAGMV